MKAYPSAMAGAAVALGLVACSGGSSPITLPSGGISVTRTLSQPPSPPPQQAPTRIVAPPTSAVTVTVTVTPAPAVSVTASSATVSSAPVSSAPASSSADDDTPWGWIVAAIVVFIAIVAAIVMAVRRHQRAKHVQEWRAETAGAVDAAYLARDLLPTSGADIHDDAQWQTIRESASQAAAELDTSGMSAPERSLAAAAHAAARSLRGLLFALDSAHLLSGASPPPSADQLAQADAVVQRARTELDAALLQLGPGGDGQDMSAPAG